MSLQALRYVQKRAKHNQALEKCLISLRFFGIIPPSVEGIPGLRIMCSTSRAGAERQPPDAAAHSFQAGRSPMAKGLWSRPNGQSGRGGFGMISASSATLWVGAAGGVGVPTISGSSSVPVALGPEVSWPSRQLSVSNPPQLSQIGCHCAWIA